jgi:hypothetical protein
MIKQIAAITVAIGVGTAGSAQPTTLPSRLSDAEFWRMVTTMSEPGGQFNSNNWVSNEMNYPAVIATLRMRGDTGGVYLGVGPEQNFSYVAGLRPRMAFVVDIRRQAMVQHLWYKAIFELSADRAEFLSMVFARPRPAGLTERTGVTDLIDAYGRVSPDSGLHRRNIDRVLRRLREEHGFTVDSSDARVLTAVADAFFRLGPALNYMGNVGQSVIEGGRPSPANDELRARYGGVNFGSIVAAMDDDRIPRSFLATEEQYRFVKDMQSRNLVVPLVGDFAGPKTLRSVGQYLRDANATLSVFYVSNVERYLANPATAFYSNVATIPVTASSVFIRSGSTTCPIAAFLAAVAAGRIRTAVEAAACMR